MFRRFSFLSSSNLVLALLEFCYFPFLFIQELLELQYSHYMFIRIYYHQTAAQGKRQRKRDHTAAVRGWFLKTFPTNLKSNDCLFECEESSDPPLSAITNPRKESQKMQEVLGCRVNSLMTFQHSFSFCLEIIRFLSS